MPRLVCSLVIFLLISVTSSQNVWVIPTPDSYHLDLIKDLFDLPPFYVGSVHSVWVRYAEMGPLTVAHRAMEGKSGKCFAVDVGMNDGFYTQLSAAHGCNVIAFEFQESCIALSRNATTANGFNNLVSIFRAPVSNKNNEILKIPRGDSEAQKVCDGGFELKTNSNGADEGSVFHGVKAAFEVKSHHHLYTVRLDSLIPPTAFVDFLKIDIEGHELEAVQGAEQLFKSHRIGRAVMEITHTKWRQGIDFDEAITVFERIMSYGYSVLCVTEQFKNRDWTVVEKNITFNDFKRIVRTTGKASGCVDWEFFPSFKR